MDDQARVELKNKSVTSLTTTSQEILPRNGARRYLMMTNPNSGTVWFSFGATPAAVGGAGSFPIAGGGAEKYCESGDSVPIDAINFIAESASDTKITIYEG